MGSATNRNPARRLDDTSSLVGVLEFRPRLTIVLVFLTLMVAVVGWRIARDTGARRVDVLAREAIGLFDAGPSAAAATAPPDAAEAEERIRALAGVTIGFPRDDADFVPVEVRRETFANRPAASLRFRYAGEGYLLVVSARDRLLGILRRGVPRRVVRLGGAGRQVVRPVGARGGFLHRGFRCRRDAGVRPGPSTVHLIRNRTEFAKEGLR